MIKKTLRAKTLQKEGKKALKYTIQLNIFCLKVFFWAFKEDLIYLFQNKFLFRTLYLFYSCNPVVLYLADINYMAYLMLDFHLV